jgi:polyphosphate kinase
VPDGKRLAELAAAPLPLGLRAGVSRSSFHRDLYFDTPEGDLRRRGASCCVRFDVEDRRTLVFEVSGMGRFDAPVAALEPGDMFQADAGPARRLRALVDPARLELEVELEIDRTLRVARLPVVRVPQCVFAYDTITTRGNGPPALLYELVAWPARWGMIPTRRLARAVAARYGLPRTSGDRQERATAARQRALTEEAGAAPVARRVALLALAHGRIALVRTGPALVLPLAAGGGEEGCRGAMRHWFGNAEGEVRLLGVVPESERGPAIEVWLARRLRRDVTGAPPGALRWFAPPDIVARIGSPVLRDPATLAALAVAARSELVPEWAAAPLAPPAPADRPARGTTDETSRLTLSELRIPSLSPRSLDAARPTPDQFINAQLSTLEFNARVLALAEDPGTPLRARLRFLAIFSTNLDQFFMIDVAGLKHQAAQGVVERSPDGLTPTEQLDAIAIRLRPLVARQYRAFRELARGPASAAGIEIRDWPDLTPEERAPLERRFTEEFAPLLTPKALTRAPGHPFPHLADRRLSLAVALRDEPSGPLHFAAVELPATLPRFVAPPAGGFVPLEAVARARLGALFPGREVVEAHAFRVTRSGDIQLDDLVTASFRQAIADEVRRRPWGPVVRVEVERAMPAALRDVLHRELRFEESALASTLGPSDVYDADGPVDLGALGELVAGPARAGLDYPEFTPRDPFAGAASVLEAVERREVLVHHPYDSFSASVERFIVEAADDPDVAVIKLTLYRPGGPSRIGDALRRAAARGKDVSVFVELKARFDEELNIGWAQSLEAAGIHVVTGIVALKTHAKIALVVRRRDGRTRRYAHIGTGNYNLDTASAYADFGLFTADEGITADLHALFNELTGSSRAPLAKFERLLVAPSNMLDRFLALIAREAEHARAGRGGRIRAKLNSLADATVIGALYRAAQAGVVIDLVVRGICMLRPGVPGLSDRIRVVSVLGRFLEHGRIYHFANGGDPAYYIGSADWRPRNLRRRVEVATPVRDPAAHVRLDRVLERELADPTGWLLQSDGSYVRAECPEAGTAPTAQEP